MVTVKEELGGIFVNHPTRPELRKPAVFFTDEFMPEVREEEESAKEMEAKNTFGRPYLSIDELAGLVADDRYDSTDILPAETLVGAVEEGVNIVQPIVQNPNLLAIAYHMAKFEAEEVDSDMWQLFNSLPQIASFAVSLFGAEAVITALESESAQDNVDSLFSLIRAARIELAEQKKGLVNRGVACGILQALGFTVAEIDKIKATKKIRPASLTAAA
ncbi:MAG: hypothetical protein HYT63_01710 [Candidatus Yanofskybacteria bacterium]|nr:hypothetical protein [Candidatus Yanofskybacteria bacterium]